MSNRRMSLRRMSFRRMSNRRMSVRPILSFRYIARGYAAYECRWLIILRRELLPCTSDLHQLSSCTHVRCHFAESDQAFGVSWNKDLQAFYKLTLIWPMLGGNLPPRPVFSMPFCNRLESIKSCTLVTFPEYDWATQYHDRDQSITF